MPPDEPSSSRDHPPSRTDRPVPRHRSRRAVLAGATAALASVAGCAAGDPGTSGGEGSGADDTDADGSGGGGDDDGEPGDESVAPPSASDDPFGASDVVDLETGPRTVALPGYQYRDDRGVSVLVRVEEPATADSPAVLRAGLSNERSWSQTVRLRDLPPFEPTAASRSSGEDGHHVYLVPTEDTPYARTEPEPVRGPDGYWQVSAAARDWLPDTMDLDPDETVGGLFYVLGAQDGTDFPPGAYEFGLDETLSMTVWNTDEPGPTPNSRFEPDELPQLPLEEDTVWYHETDPDTPRYLVPSEESGELPAGAGFELVNNSAESLNGGGGTWDLYKLVDGEWFLLDPRWRTAEARVLAAGARRSWQFVGFHGPVPDGVEGAVRGHLGGGTYAFRARFRLDREETYAAAIELAGPQLDPGPRDGVETERDGDRVVVTGDRFDADSPATATIERIDDAEDAADVDERVIAEQLSSGREPGLRNVLPFFESDVEAVGLRTGSWTARSVVPGDADARRFTYRGDAFEATWSEESE